VSRRPPVRAKGQQGERDVTLPDIICAPELAVLGLLDHALRISAEALLAAHPALVGEPPPWRISPDLLAARRLLTYATRLSRAIVDYRHCVAQPVDAPDASDGTDDDPAF